MSLTIVIIYIYCMCIVTVVSQASGKLHVQGKHPVTMKIDLVKYTCTSIRECLLGRLVMMKIDIEIRASVNVCSGDCGINNIIFPVFQETYSYNVTIVC